MNIYQINLQQQFGGGETYTAFVCRALASLGHRITLVHHKNARFWANLSLPEDTVRIALNTLDELQHSLPERPAWLMSHSYLPPSTTVPISSRHLLTGMAHMPIQGRKTDGFSNFRKVFAVSQHVLDGLLEQEIPAWRVPLYGIADLNRRAQSDCCGKIERQSCFDWDRRKFRDRFLAVLEPLGKQLLPKQAFSPQPGISLGIVSRITTIKQFDRLFGILAPRLESIPDIYLDIFGSGGYASIRDLKRSLTPIRDRVRFWGHQNNVQTVYGKIDYLITGLPEKEALGLNVLEAQCSDVPVLAVNAPPFTETVVEGATGFFYRDPREDNGQDFVRLIDQIRALKTPLHPALATENLQRFSFEAFVERLRPVVAWAHEKLGQ